MQQSNEGRTPTARLAMASGILLLLTLGSVGASVVQIVSGGAALRPADVPFDIQVFGVEGTDVPATVVWAQGNPTAVLTTSTAHESTLAPGGERTFTVGARNNSTEATAAVSMSVYDTDPLSVPDLYDVLEITVERDGRVLARGTGREFSELEIPVGTLRAGEAVELTVTLALPASTDNTYNSASTGVGVQMRGESR